MPQIRQSQNPKAKETGRDRGGKRFPNLLNASINVIANVVLDTAKENYEREYAKMFAAASSQSREYPNQIYCSAMATRGEYSGDRQLAAAGPAAG